MGPLIILGALFALMWACLIRPQRKAASRPAEVALDDVEPGDEVLTVGGIYGIVHELDEDEAISSSRSPRASGFGSHAAPSRPL